MTTTDDMVRRLAAERDVMETLECYGRCIDGGDAAGWAGCFTDDGVFEIRLRRGDRFEPWGRYQGATELEDFARTHSHAPAEWHRHVLLGSVVDVDLGAGEATVSSSFARLDDGASGPYLRAFGRYSDHLRRGDDGRWRLQRRRAEIESIAPGAWPHRVTGPKSSG